MGESLLERWMPQHTNSKRMKQLSGPDVVAKMLNRPTNSVALYQKVAEHSPIPMAMTIGPTHLLCVANLALCELLGTEAQGLLGQPMIDAVPTADMERLLAILDRVYRTGEATLGIDQPLIQSAHDQVYWNYSIWPITDDDGHPTGLVLLLDDATSHHHAEQAAIDSRAVNEQLLIAGLRELELSEELQRQLTVTDAIAKELARSHARLEQALSEVQALALTDELTGLYNRRGFLTLALQQMKLAKRTKHTLSLIFVDLDGLKDINDRCGHTMGSQAIAQTAHILSATFRDSDIIARYGGDEFVVLAMDSDAQEQDQVLQRLQTQCMQYNLQANVPYQLSMSIGIAHSTADQPCSLDELLGQADAQMYRHKQTKYTTRS